MKADQTMEYGVSSVFPSIMGNQTGAAARGDAATIVSWTLYQVYGDKEILKEQYESMKGWVEYIWSIAINGLLWQTGFQYGDWLALDKEEMADRIGATDKYQVATAYYAHSTWILKQAADILGNEADYREYCGLYENIREAFNEEYITKTGRLVSETQTSCILALHFNLAREEYRERIVESLKKNLEAHKNHLVTGFVGTPYISHVLSDNGLHHMAGKLMMQEDYPSWLYAVKKGATTIWERWNSMLSDGSFEESGMNSFNHYTYGSIGECEWLYQKVAGIRLIEPGYKKIRIEPMFIKGITWVKATLDSMYGPISVDYSCVKGKITVEVTIPANTTAIIRLPETEEDISVSSGYYRYEYTTTTNLYLNKYSMDSTLGSILDNPIAVGMLEESVQGMTTNPMIKFAYGQTITELIAMMPEGGNWLFQEVIDVLNKAE